MKTLALLAIAGMTAGMTFAQDSQRLTIQDAIESAMKNNIQVITAQNNYNEVAANVLPKTWGNNLPTVDANARVSRSNVSSNFFTNEGAKSSRNTYSYSLNANYTIFDGFRRFSEMSSARRDEESAAFNLERTRQDVVLQVYNAYFTVLKNQQLLRISEENLKRSEEQLKRLEERNRLGAQILSDVYRQRVQVGSDKLALNRAKNNLNTSKATLNNVIGIDVNTPVELDDGGLNIDLEAVEGKYDDQVTSALEHRKDYLAAKARYQSSRASLRSSRSGFFPTLSAFAQYSWFDGFLPGSFKEYDPNDQFNIGLTLSIPIFNGFQTSSSVVQANQRVQTARSNMENARRQVALDVKIAQLNLQTSLENVKLAMENVKSAKEDLRLATERYNLGAATILDQITANTNFATAEANHVQAVYDYLYAREQYLLAIGTTTIK